MATWKVTPQWKKSIIERQFWTKDDNTFVFETCWRGGEFTVVTEDDNPPELEPGVDILNCGYDSEMVETFDGCSEDYDFDDCDEETQEWLEEFLEDNSVFDLEEHGWYSSDCEMIIDCGINIERVND